MVDTVRHRLVGFLSGTLTVMRMELSVALSLDGLWRVEVRPTPGKTVDTGAGDVEASELWLVQVKTKKAERLLRGRPDSDIKKSLAGFSSLCFALEGRSVSFVSAAWATSGSVQKLDLKTRRVQFLIDGNDVTVIKRGASRGRLLVTRALIKYDKQGESLGRGEYVWIVSPEGKPLREVGEAESKAVTAFRKSAL